MEITEEEKKIILMLRELKPYGKLEIAMNQNNSQLSIYLTNVIKEVIPIKGKWKAKEANQKNQEI